MGIRNIKRGMRGMKSKEIKTIEEKFTLLWIMHFGHTDLYPGDGASCEKCVDYIEMGCPGGKVPEDCIKEQALTADIKSG